jgi:GntR family transcriptional regulator
MRFSINPSSVEPVYAQIARQAREAVARGRLRPGDRLPTVRELALELLINPNTIAAAYREMERAGLVHTQRGRGTFIAEIQSPSSAAERRRQLQKHVEALLTEATHLGLSEEEILDAVRTVARKYRLREEKNDE